jgi:hypothetical protein
LKIKVLLAIVVAVVIVLAAKYFGLFHGPVILGGQVVSFARPSSELARASARLDRPSAG